MTLPGHVQLVREVRLDCDGDTVLVRVDQHGSACHTGARTCFDDGALLEGFDDARLGARMSSGEVVAVARRVRRTGARIVASSR